MLLQSFHISVDCPHNDVYTAVLATQCFLSVTEYAALHNKIRKLINGHLKNHLKSVSTNEVLETLGFPADWHITTEKIDTTK